MGASRPRAAHRRLCYRTTRPHRARRHRRRGRPVGTGGQGCEAFLSAAWLPSTTAATYLPTSHFGPSQRRTPHHRSHASLSHGRRLRSPEPTTSVSHSCLPPCNSTTPFRTPRPLPLPAAAAVHRSPAACLHGVIHGRTTPCKAAIARRNRSPASSGPPAGLDGGIPLAQLGGRCLVIPIRHGWSCSCSCSCSGSSSSCRRRRRRRRCYYYLISACQVLYPHPALASLLSFLFFLSFFSSSFFSSQRLAPPQEPPYSLVSIHFTCQPVMPGAISRLIDLERPADLPSLTALRTKPT